MPVSNNDLLDTNWKDFRVLKHKIIKDNFIIVLFCKDKESCVHFMQLLINNTYRLSLFDYPTYKFFITFNNSDKELFIEFDKPANDLKEKLQNGMIKYITTGYFMNETPFLNETILPLSDDSFLLN